MQLEKPSEKWQNEHLAYISEWGEGKLSPNRFRLEPDASYNQFLDQLTHLENGQLGQIPTSNFFLVNDDRILGMVTIRHRLNDYLLNVDGHIGCSIRPSERRKGYATKILSEAMKITDELGIEDVLITCNEDNIGSAKAILNNGGVEAEPFEEEHGNVIRRFWINRRQ